MKHHKDSIVLNGQSFGLVSGNLIHEDGPLAGTKLLFKHHDLKLSHHKKPHLVRHSPQSSRTLMRKGLSKPQKATTSPKKQLSKVQKLTADRNKRAKNIAKSSHVKHFASNKHGLLIKKIAKFPVAKPARHQLSHN